MVRILESSTGFRREVCTKLPALPCMHWARLGAACMTQSLSRRPAVSLTWSWLWQVGHFRAALSKSLVALARKYAADIAEQEADRLTPILTSLGTRSVQQPHLPTGRSVGARLEGAECNAWLCHSQTLLRSAVLKITQGGLGLQSRLVACI